jgi:uncharacterized protein YqgV (UPF0045/DUF77 family)
MILLRPCAKVISLMSKNLVRHMRSNGYWRGEGPVMIVQAEISLYPLGEKELAAPIYTFVRRMERDGLKIEPGAMSTLVVGEDELVFTALREAYEETCRTGRRIMVVKLLNATE